MSILKNPVAFSDDFTRMYVEQSFGVMGKRDLEVLVLYLIIKHGDGFEDVNFFDLSRLLKMSERKVRNLYQEVQLRYETFNELQAKKEFVELFQNQRFQVVGDKYKLQIRNPLLRQYVTEWVDNVNGIFDSSFNSMTVVLSRDILIAVIEQLVPMRLGELKERLSNKVDETVTNANSMRKLIDRFVEKYVDTLAERSADGTLAVLGTGLSVILGV